MNAFKNNLQIKAVADHQIVGGNVKIRINAPMTTKNAGQPTRNTSTSGLNGKNSFFNRMIQVS
jgi:hypothetical protein